MVLRRELLPILLAAAFLLIGPGQALAAPQWRPAEPQDPSATPTVPADVAADTDGNSVAVWLGAGDTVYAAFRHRGGPWEAAVDLEPDYDVVDVVAPRVVARPDGVFVAVWSADRNGDGDDVLRSATRSLTGTWTAEDIRDPCCSGINALEAGRDGNVTVVSPDDGGSSSNTKPPGNAPWGETQSVSIGAVEALAAGPGGSAVAVRRGTCGPSPCIRSAFRPLNGPWGPDLPGPLTGQLPATGLALVANPDATSTLLWGQESPGAALSADRSAGPDGEWSDPETVGDLGADLPGCRGGNCFDLAIGPDGSQLAVWRQSGVGVDQISANLRSSGGSWGGLVEDVGDTGSAEAAPFAGITTSGIPVVAWGSSGQNDAVAHGSHRDPGGVWHPVALGTPAEATVYLGDLAIDGDGNALTAWKESPGIVATAGFDGGGPRFSAFSVPSGTAGQSLAFSAAAADNWSSLASISWLFGDGGSAFGGAVSHAYGAAGSYAATATATDTVGNATQQPGTVIVAAPTPGPTPDPCGTADTDKDGIKNGCDDNNGAKRPVAFKTVNATVVSGDVFVKLPAGSASVSQAKPPKGFKRLEGAETIPVGSTLDTARGRVKIRSASDTKRHVQTGQFFRGRFLIRQVRRPRGKSKRRSTKLITDMRLSGSSFRKRCRVTASVSQRRKRSKKKVRRLFGDAKGSFRTSGRNAAATVRGTRWGVQDRCDGTLVAVQRGRVEVRDKVKRKTIVLRRGRTYLARTR